MFKRQRQFNIITGTVLPQPLLQSSRSYYNNVTNFHDKSLTNFTKTKLGVPKDKKQFQYCYTQSSPHRQISLAEKNPQKQQKSKSMVNYVSTAYNIINHMGQLQTARIANKNTFSQILPQINKKSPLTQHIHRNRLLAPNLHQNYPQRTQKREFFKKQGLCSSICDVQKSYGQGRYFRRLK